MVTKKDIRSAYLKCLENLSDKMIVGTKESAGFNEHADGVKTQVFVEVQIFSDDLLRNMPETGGLLSNL